MLFLFPTAHSPLPNADTLLAAVSFIPHGHCYLWKPGLVWLHVLSDAWIAAAYYAIPFILLYWIRKREDTPFPWVFGLFSAFIFACGTTHLANIWTLWHPTYWLSGALKAATAGVSVYTAIALFPVASIAVTLPSAKQLEAMNQTLQQEIRDREQAQAQVQALNAQLEQRIQARTAELEQINQELTQEKERYQTLVIATSQTVWICDAEGRTQQASDEWLDVTGQREVDTHGFGWLEAVHPSDRDRTKQVWLQAVNTQTQYETEYRIQTVWGEYREIVARGVPVLEPDGHVREWVGTCTDVTERNQLERALQASEAKLNDILSQASAAIVSFRVFANRTFEFDYFSTGCKTVFGFTAQELMADQDLWFSRLKPSNRDTIQAIAYDYFFAERPLTIQYQFHHKDGTFRWLTDTFITRRDDVADCWIVTTVATDITRLKQTEAALKQGEERLRWILQNMPVMLDTFDEQGNILVWNQECERMTGYSEAEIVGNPDAMDLLYPDKTYLQTMMQAWQEAGNDYRNWEWDITCKDGSTKTIAWSNISDQFPIPGWASWGMGVDVSDRKQAERQIRQLNKALAAQNRNLETLIEQRTAELTKRTQQLEATNQELESFSYSVSHDLRAPLRHINGFVAALTKQLAQYALTDPKVNHYLHVIEDSSQRMGQLIDGLLTLSRVGRRQMEHHPVLLSRLAEQAINLVQSAHAEAAIVFEIAELPTVLGDRILLQQVFSNLIDNAVKFSRQRQPAQITVGITQDGAIFVRDNGVGFDRTYVDQLFGAFQRLHSRDQFEGTGIGLTIVQRIVHRHGGTIWAESELDQGACFYFRLNSEEPAS